MDEIGHPVNFKHSDYDYRVNCGVVMAPNSISWDGPTYVCQDWEAVNRLHDMWAQFEDYPALRVRLEYNESEKATPP